MNKITFSIKSCVPHIGVVFGFFLLVLIYFYPAFEGKVIQQTDIVNYAGMAHELEEYGKPSGWTGSMFSGMPSYQITGYSPSVDFISWLRVYVLGAFHSHTAGPIFILLLTAYLFFLVMGARWWLAALGAIMTAFSSYNIIIMEAGHITKAWTLSFVPVVLAGMTLIFKKRYWAGLLTFTLGLALMITSNHLQITYYTALFCAILFVGFVIQQIIEGKYKHLGIATGILFIGGALAVLANANNLYVNYESGQESMRGKSELVPQGQIENATPASKGLDKDYVFAWSYGKAETLSLLIPNVMGGASGGSVGPDSHLYKELKAHGAQVGKEVQTYTYWGEVPFTSGPIYFGAIVCFLFLLAFFIVPEKVKWRLLGITIIFIFLAWGRNLAWFNDWMYYYFPLYSKFRAVSMALVIPGFIFPILAVLAVKELVTNELAKEKLLRSLYWSAGITGGICLALWMMPGVFFNFQSSYDASILNQAPDWYYTALLEDRKDLLRADALRSFVFIALAAGLIFMYIRSKNRAKFLPFFAAGLVLLVVCDLWQVDKRYLSAKNFLPKNQFQKQLFPKSTADEFILQDPAISYRVLNLNNPFNESRTSYHHKSIGGYHAAKLGRYQDLIEHRLTKEIQSIIASFPTATSLDDLVDVCVDCPTLNMLNAKYILFNPEYPPLINPHANGNAWFVQSYFFVDTPDEEMAALHTLDPRIEAVFDRRFENYLSGLDIIPDPTVSIQMTAYYPNRVEYRSSSTQTGLVVFSEIYYRKGWKAFINGEPAPIHRANWILRALVVPAGDHHIKFVFDPDDIRVSGTITAVFSGLLLLLVITTLAFIAIRGAVKNKK